MATPITPMRLEADVVALLAALAEKLGTSRTEVVREALREMAKRRGVALEARIKR